MTTIVNGTSGITFSDGSVQNTAAIGFRNRIINGAMVIDQRNAGASVTNTASVTYTLDRWASFGSQASKFTVQQNAGSVTPPAGFTNYLGVTSSSAYTVGSSEGFWIRQPIEGFNIADLGWGTANAKTVTLSFWVRSSLTGTFGGSLIDNFTPLSYPFSYTISSANTWEQKTVTITGPTSGTFPTGNTTGVFVVFGLGNGSTLSGTAGSWQSANLQNATGATSVVGTNGATFYITGVQLEKGTTASSFDFRSYPQELAMCQRYYEKSYAMATAPGTSTAYTAGMSSVTNGYSSSAYIFTNTYFRVAKRASATMAYWDAAGNASRTTYLTGGGLSQVDNNNVVYAFTGSEEMALMNLLGVPSYNYCFHWTASAEL